MKSSPLFLVAYAVTAALSGCGTAEETAEEKPPAPQQRPAQVPVRRLEFETRTDTVTALHGTERKPEGVPGRAMQVRYMVQIGAFKDPHRASDVQSSARKRYKMPVLNDYHAARGLYQIRLGFFVSRESAHEFRQRMIKEFPSEYGDSWVVQLKR
jgi:cell division septation protein DedD